MSNNDSNEKIKEKLRNISLFVHFKDDDAALEKIAGTINIREFPKGSYIIKEGDRGDEMYILSKGRVSIEKTTLQDDSYTIVKLSDNMNVFFGELALLDNDVRSASIIAETDCECFCIKKEDFERMGNEDTCIGLFTTREIAKMLAGRLRNTSRDNIVLFEALVSEIEDTE